MARIVSEERGAGFFEYQLDCGCVMRVYERWMMNSIPQRFLRDAADMHRCEIEFVPKQRSGRDRYAEEERYLRLRENERQWRSEIIGTWEVQTQVPLAKPPAQAPEQVVQRAAAQAATQVPGTVGFKPPDPPKPAPKVDQSKQGDSKDRFLLIEID